MPRNIEVKARLHTAARLAALRGQVAEAADAGPEVLLQRDTFFRVAHGRLKLREEREELGGGEGGPLQARLIPYQRADGLQSKASDYRLVELQPGQVAALREALAMSCGMLGEVSKRRTLYRIGRMRVHLDEVEGLGPHLELEVVMADGEADAAGHAEARHWLERWGIAEADLLAPAYLDLLLRGAAGGGPAE